MTHLSSIGDTVMNGRQRDRNGVGSLETLLVVAVLILMFQMRPAISEALTWLDPRLWTRLTWFIANAVVLAVLCGMRYGPARFAKLVVLALKFAGVLLLAALLVHLAPLAWPYVRRAMDFRTWPASAWMAFNAALVLALVAIRFGPDAVRRVRESVGQRMSARVQKTVVQSDQERKAQLAAERELYERMQKARKRQIY